MEKVSRILAEHVSGALFFAEKFSLLIYPTRCVAWRFLDTGFGCNPSPEAKLRFAMFTPQPPLRTNHNIDGTEINLVTPSIGAQVLHINRVFQTHFGMEFSRVSARSIDKGIGKTRSTDTFFLLFPPAAQEDCNLFVEWIQANSTAATIYRHEDRGAWDHFHKSVDNGVIIVRTNVNYDALLLISPIVSCFIPRVLGNAIPVVRSQEVYQYVQFQLGAPIA